MSSSTGRQTAISLTGPPRPRLRLQPDRSARPLLAAVTPLASPAAVTASPSIQLSIWEWEGGQLRDPYPASSISPPSRHARACRGPKTPMTSLSTTSRRAGGRPEGVVL